MCKMSFCAHEWHPYTNFHADSYGVDNTETWTKSDQLKRREISNVSELTSQLMSLHQITKHSLCLAKNNTQTGNRKVWHNRYTGIRPDLINCQ